MLAPQGINRDESLGLLLQIVSGLEHVHACGLVHRDLKPANCCFHGERLKLLDFGLAKVRDDWCDDAAGGGDSDASTATSTPPETPPLAPSEPPSLPPVMEQAGASHASGSGQAARRGLGSHALGSGQAGKSGLGFHASVLGQAGRSGLGSSSAATVAPEVVEVKRPAIRSGQRDRRARQGVGTAGVGTASYSAPEQLEHGVARSHCDMFPLGLIAYELFHPFGSAMERAKDFGTLRSGAVPSKFAGRWARLARLIARLVSADPWARPLCAEVLSALLEIRHEWEQRSSASSQTNTPAVPPTRRSGSVDSDSFALDQKILSQSTLLSPLLPPAAPDHTGGAVDTLSPLLQPAAPPSLTLGSILTSPGAQRANGAKWAAACRAPHLAPGRASPLILSESVAERQRREAAACATGAELARLRVEMAIMADEMRAAEGGGVVASGW